MSYSNVLLIITQGKTSDELSDVNYFCSVKMKTLVYLESENMINH